MTAGSGGLRIGELGRRVGVSPELLRAWERRYALFQPDRSAGGFRLYSAQDEARARSMQRHLAHGLAAAQAARAALLEGRPADVGVGLVESRVALQTALERYEEAEAEMLLDRLLGVFAVDTIMRGVILPVLAAMGERWHNGDIGVAEEHFASTLLRARLLALARGWGRGGDPVALLASPPGERHDIPLIAFGITLRQSGWKIAFLGADTPVLAMLRAADAIDADVVVLSTIAEHRLGDVERELIELAAHRILAIGGPGATSELSERLGATLLRGDPVAAATTLAGGFHASDATARRQARSRPRSQD